MPKFGLDALFAKPENNGGKQNNWEPNRAQRRAITRAAMRCPRCNGIVRRSNLDRHLDIMHPNFEKDS